MKLPGQAEVDFGKVDEHGCIRPARANGFFQLAELAVDAGQVEDNLGQAHHGHIFRADYALQAGGGHALAAHAEEPGCPAGCGELFFQRLNQQRAVVLAAGLACRDEDVGGHGWIAPPFQALETIIAGLNGADSWPASWRAYAQYDVPEKCLDAKEESFAEHPKEYQPVDSQRQSAEN